MFNSCVLLFWLFFGILATDVWVFVTSLLTVTSMSKIKRILLVIIIKIICEIYRSVALLERFNL